MKNNLVSIIIPTYKSWDLLEKCLCAIDEQTYTGEYEVLVVNNDVDPQHPIEILNHKNLRILQELKPGSYAARNKGIAESRGEILVFTDADCIPDKNWLKNGVSKLLETNAGIIAGDVKLFYKNPDKLTAAEVYDKYTGFDQKGYVKYGNCITANWFSFKKTMEEFGNFNPKLKSNGDSDLSGKISKKYPVLFAEDAVVFHPARHTIDEIILKHKRLIGGTYDRVYKGTEKDFNQYVRNFIFRRFKFNLNLFRKLKVQDGLMILKIHRLLFPEIKKEAKRIQNNGSTERI